MFGVRTDKTSLKTASNTKKEVASKVGLMSENSKSKEEIGSSKIVVKEKSSKLVDAKIAGPSRGAVLKDSKSKDVTGTSQKATSACTMNHSSRADGVKVALQKEKPSKLVDAKIASPSRGAVLKDSKSKDVTGTSQKATSVHTENHSSKAEGVKVALSKLVFKKPKENDVAVATSVTQMDQQSRLDGIKKSITSKIPFINDSVSEEKEDTTNQKATSTQPSKPEGAKNIVTSRMPFKKDPKFKEDKDASQKVSSAPSQEQPSKLQNVKKAVTSAFKRDNSKEDCQKASPEITVIPRSKVPLQKNNRKEENSISKIAASDKAIASKAVFKKDKSKEESCTAQKTTPKLAVTTRSPFKKDKPMVDLKNSPKATTSPHSKEKLSKQEEIKKGTTHKLSSKRDSQEKKEETDGSIPRSKVRENLNKVTTDPVVKAKDVIKHGAEKTTKAIVSAAGNAISAAPDKAKKITGEIDMAASSAYSHTKHALANPKDLVQDAKKTADQGLDHLERVAKSAKKIADHGVRDIERVMATVKQNGLKFADEIDGAVDKIVEKGEEIIFPTSRQHLTDAELCVFKDIHTEYQIMDIKVEKQKEESITVHTICFEPRKKILTPKLPLVMIHGLGGGLPCFHQNYGNLCQDRKVYGIDLPGFALSSRVHFPKSPLECRDRMITLLDKWRQAMKIDKFILLGHSFGGHLSAAYTVKYHGHVRHLILADAWGIISKEEDSTREDPQLWQKAAMSISNMLKFNPFSAVRGAGLLGPILANAFMPEETKTAYGDQCSDYFYHALAQNHATGESAFSVISGYEYIWPADAMKHHLMKLTPSVPITFIYGEKSPFNNRGGTDIKEKRANTFVLDPLPDIGHHVQIQDAGLFNKKLKEILTKVDKNNDSCRKGH